MSYLFWHFLQLFDYSKVVQSRSLNSELAKRDRESRKPTMAFKMNDEGGENFKLQLVFGGHYHQTLRACLAGRQAILRPVGRLGSSVREFPEHVFSSSLKFGIIEFDNVRKGQLISKCLFEKIVWTKIPPKNLIDSALKVCGQNLSNFLVVFWSKQFFKQTF